MLNRKMFLSVVAATLLLSAAVADAFADEMRWDVKTHGKMQCTLRDGMTLKRGLDFVETKHLTCKEGNHTVLSRTVACGPEGSLTRFKVGKGKGLVVCHTVWFASK